MSRSAPIQQLTPEAYISTALVPFAACMLTGSDEALLLRGRLLHSQNQIDAAFRREFRLAVHRQSGAAPASRCRQCRQRNGRRRSEGAAPAHDAFDRVAWADRSGRHCRRSVRFLRGRARSSSRRAVLGPRDQGTRKTKILSRIQFKKLRINFKV